MLCGTEGAGADPDMLPVVIIVPWGIYTPFQENVIENEQRGGSLNHNDA